MVKLGARRAPILTQLRGRDTHALCGPCIVWSMPDVVQSWGTSVRGTISKGALFKGHNIQELSVRDTSVGDTSALHYQGDKTEGLEREGLEGEGGEIGEGGCED